MSVVSISNHGERMDIVSAGENCGGLGFPPGVYDDSESVPEGFSKEGYAAYMAAVNQRVGDMPGRVLRSMGGITVAVSLTQR